MKISWIEEGLVAASSVPVGQKDLSSLYAQGIRAVVTLTEHPITIQRGVSLDYLRASGIDYLHAAVVDHHPPDLETMWRVIDFAQARRRERRPVFFHCQAGVGRMGTLLHSYYLSLGLDFEQAKKMIKLRRPACQYIILSATQKGFLHRLVETDVFKKGVER